MAHAGIGSATVVNHCAKPVYFHVSGFKDGIAWDSETQVIPAEGFTMPYETSVSIKLSHDPAQLQGSISQLEFNLDTATGRIWYDLSNVDAFRAGPPPFMQGGMHLTPHGDTRGNCRPVYCQKGQLICKDVYNLWDDDMTFDCAQATDLRLVLCPHAGPRSPQPPPAAAPPHRGGPPARCPASAIRLPALRGRAVDKDTEQPDSVMVGGLTWQIPSSGSNSNSSRRSTIGKFPLLGIVASGACYFISMWR
jgi:hypothetical protein